MRIDQSKNCSRFVTLNKQRIKQMKRLMNKLKTKTEITRRNKKHARQMQIANASTDRS